MEECKTLTFCFVALLSTLQLTHSDEPEIVLTGLPNRWSDLLVSTMASIGRNLTGSQEWGSHMREVGFEHVTERRFHVPINTWARGKKNKLLGALCAQNLSEGVASMSMAAFTRIMGWSREKLEVFLVDVRKNLMNKDIHAYIVVYIAYGKKPGLVEHRGVDV